MMHRCHAPYTIGLGTRQRPRSENESSCQMVMRTIFSVASVTLLLITLVPTADKVCVAEEVTIQDAEENDSRTDLTTASTGSLNTSIAMHTLLIFTEWSQHRETFFTDCMATMYNHMVHDNHCLHFHVIVDATTTQLVLQTVHRIWCHTNNHWMNLVKVSLYDLKDVHGVIQPYQNVLQRHFSNVEVPYYNRTIFFVGAVLHKLLPETVDKVIAFDIDIKFNASVAELYKHFNLFSPTNILGLAHEQQPTYMHFTEQYRARNPETLVGGPPPIGWPGFNSGVMLAHLMRLRRSDIYNRMLEPQALNQLAGKYTFQSNLGDQDFYTLLSFDYPELFYVLPCNWNRQLCRWFETHGYGDYFDAYHRCEGDIYIYHGNCNSTLPSLGQYK